MEPFGDSQFRRALEVKQHPLYVALRAELAAARRERTAAVWSAKKQKARAELWRHRALRKAS